MDFEKEYFANKLNFKIKNKSKDYVEIEAEPKLEDTNLLELVHGGYIFSLGDYSSALLANQNKDNCVSANASIHYLSPAKISSKLISKSKISVEKNNTLIIETKIYSQEELVANMQVQLISRKAK